MMRLVNISLAICLVALIGALYHIRYSAESEARSLRKLERQIALEHDRRRTLQAEWSSLNDPRRLQILSREYLSLDTVRATQIIDMRPRHTQTIPVVLPTDMPTELRGVDEPR